jgi:hypothetical protein
MKNLTKINLPIIPLFLLLNGCGFQNRLTSNVNSSQTSVVLSPKKHKVIDRVNGTSTVKYIFGIGEISAKAIVEKAKTSMVNKSNFNGGAKANIYPSVEGYSTCIIRF